MVKRRVRHLSLCKYIAEKHPGDAATVNLTGFLGHESILVLTNAIRYNVPSPSHVSDISKNYVN